MEEARTIVISAGNLRNGHFYLTNVSDWIPESAIGAAKLSDGRGDLIRLDLEGLPEPVYSDVPRSPDGKGRRNFFRCRAEIRKFFGANGVSPGAELSVERAGPLHWRVRVLTKGQNTEPPNEEPVPIPPPEPVNSISPPVENIQALLERLPSIAGLPERNMEDAVKEFLLLLGHRAERIRFQVGRIDICVQDEQGQPWGVIEVKKSLRSPSQVTQALRQGFDYANRNGARFVVITDADEYRIYDRDRGRDYESQFVGGFQLLEFKEDDVTVLDLLRSSGWSRSNGDRGPA